MNGVPQGERVHIGIFGRGNAGKSSLLNALTGQKLAIVSEYVGTTTDPVRKAMELLPIGPVVMIDTPGLDDEGVIGNQRISQAKRCMEEVDYALLVMDVTSGLSEVDKELAEALTKRKIPFLYIYNKCDLIDKEKLEEVLSNLPVGIGVSASEGEKIDEIRIELGKLWLRNQGQSLPLVADLVEEGETVILVIPIDEAAPKGRIILPQQQVLRELLEKNCVVNVVTPCQLRQSLSMMKELPKLVITDSQAFGQVQEMLPKDVLLTSFSILMARRKGNFEDALLGTGVLAPELKPKKILISEGCSHRRQCGDIGTVKIPGWLKAFFDTDFEIVTTSGREFPEDVSEYDLIIHCGGCMLGEREMRHRYALAKEAGIPMTNYGMTIAKTHGILERSIEVLNRNSPI